MIKAYEALEPYLILTRILKEEVTGLHYILTLRTLQNHLFHILIPMDTKHPH
jgi:dimeric dUTPase (all-alpha-NTP-PPase superfamily)